MKKAMISLAFASLASVAVAQSAGPRFVKVPDADMLSSNLVGTHVYNGDEKDIGEIKDIVLSGEKTLAGYILSVGGFLGMGTRYVVVDPASVKVKYDDKDKKWHANMNATVDQLKAAPEFKYDGKWNASRS